MSEFRGAVQGPLLRLEKEVDNRYPWLYQILCKMLGEVMSASGEWNDQETIQEISIEVRIRGDDDE